MTKGWTSLSATIARLLLGFDLFVNGICWWWKILPYPSLYDPTNPHTPAFVQAMLDTHSMYPMIKAIEVAAGLMVMADAWVPLALVVVFPICVAAWSLDVFVLTNSLRANVLGWGTILLNVFLLFVYLDCYRPLLVFRVATLVPAEGTERSHAGRSPVAHALGARALTAFGVLSNAAGACTVLWLAAMIVQHFRGRP